MKQYRFFAALLIPFTVLVSLVSYRIFNLKIGQEIIFEISGYDPRDIFSGHYLTYNVDYRLKQGCQPEDSGMKGCLCYSKLDPPEGNFIRGCGVEAEKCLMLIKGSCEYDRFEAGIERFYIPEEKSEDYDRRLRSKGARLRVTVTPDGVPMAIDLIWKEGS
jgi:uncharacterized membrane-anchored protein